MITISQFTCETYVVQFIKKCIEINFVYNIDCKCIILFIIIINIIIM